MTTAPGAVTWCGCSSTTDGEWRPTIRRPTGAQCLPESVRQGPGSRLIGPDSADRFDRAAAEVIEHILDADLPASLERLRRFVKPGGRIIVSTPHNEDLDLGSAYCPVSNRLFHRWQHVRAFTPRKLEETFGNYGFRRVFLGLADFSDHRAVYDAVKSASEREGLVRDYLTSQEDAAVLAREYDEVRDLLGALPARRMDEAIAKLTRQRGLRGWLKAILFHRRQATELVSLLTEVASVWKALESRAGVLRQLADAPAANAGRGRADALDLRSGQETPSSTFGEQAGYGPMCGIAGVLRRTRPVRPGRAASHARNPLPTAGTDDEGVWVDPQGALPPRASQAQHHRHVVGRPPAHGWHGRALDHQL